MKYTEITTKISEETGIPLEVINKAYESYWLFIREKIKELPLKGNLSEEEFNELRTNFNIPSLGKLYITYDRYKRIKEKYVKTKED